MMSTSGALRAATHAKYYEQAPDRADGDLARSWITRSGNLVVVISDAKPGAVLDRAERRGIAIFHARLEPDRNVVAAIGRHKVLAFAGIGNPEKFFSTLTAAGIEVAERAGFADHHFYTAVQAQDLIARAQGSALMLDTTEKDLARLSGDPQLAALKARASALPVRLVIEEADRFRQMVLAALKRP